MSACVAHTHRAAQGKSWCGRTLAPFEWAFVNTEHAIYAGPMGSVARCRSCMTAIAHALKQGYGEQAKPSGEA